VEGQFRTEEIAEGLWRIVDCLDNHAYLVVGDECALLVDTMGGFGDLRACVEGITNVPVLVALTHGHYDHAAGSYWFDEVYCSPQEGGFFVEVDDHASRVHGQVVKEGVVTAGAPFAPRDGSRPRVLDVQEGDCFDLGHRTVQTILLPGHTPGSMGYLIEELDIFLTGDAVTPIMCLFFENSLPIDAWRETLAKMRTLPFSRFYIGHYDHAFAKEDLDSFDAAADFALHDRGMEWQHMRLQEFQGILHMAPSNACDADSPDFRAVIEKWHELPPRKRRKDRRQR
jgi:glyoxylase-like metal-dependent hydrolase (beta-lactamase superfamily II)